MWIIAPHSCDVQLLLGSTYPNMNSRKSWKLSRIKTVLTDITITNDTRLPKDMDSSSPSADKIKLEVLLRNWLKDYHTYQNVQGLKIVLS